MAYIVNAVYDSDNSFKREFDSKREVWKFVKTCFNRALSADIDSLNVTIYETIGFDGEERLLNPLWSKTMLSEQL